MPSLQTGQSEFYVWIVMTHNLMFGTLKADTFLVKIINHVSRKLKAMCVLTATKYTLSVHSPIFTESMLVQCPEKTVTENMNKYLLYLVVTCTVHVGMNEMQCSIALHSKTTYGVVSRRFHHRKNTSGVENLRYRNHQALGVMCQAHVFLRSSYTNKFYKHANFLLIPVTHQLRLRFSSKLKDT